MNKKIWILGSSNLDVTYRVKEIPLKGQTVQASACVTATGGKGANQAAAAAHWGVEVAFIGAVGDDLNGSTLEEVFRLRKIDTHNLTKVVGVPSGNAVIHVDDRGGNCIVVYPGANQFIPVNKFPEFQEGDMLVAQLEVNMDAVLHYFKLAKQKKVYTVLNPSPFVSLSEELLSLTDMIVANESEAYGMGGIAVIGAESARACGEIIMKLGPGTVVITLGKNGVVVLDVQGAFHVPEYCVEVVDTQGAGDAFLGTFIAKLAQGDTLQGAALFANMAASLTVTKLGSTQTSMPQVWELAQKNPGICIKL